MLSALKSILIVYRENDSPSRNNPRILASLSPTNLLNISLGPTLKNAARASPATAWANFVFPHPGGPCSRIEAGADRIPALVEIEFH